MNKVLENDPQIKQQLAEAGKFANLARLKIEQSLPVVPARHRVRLQRLGEIQGVLASAFAKLSVAFGPRGVVR
jgi:hypothetical protein